MSAPPARSHITHVLWPQHVHGIEPLPVHTAGMQAECAYRHALATDSSPLGPCAPTMPAGDFSPDFLLEPGTDSSGLATLTALVCST